jgi:hypothetical protein
MRRRFSTLVSALSLVAFGAIFVLWLRSYSQWDSLDWRHDTWKIEFRSADGTFAIQRCVDPDWQPYRYFLPRTQLPPRPLPGPSTMSHQLSDEEIAFSPIRWLAAEHESFWDRWWWNPDKMFGGFGFAFTRSSPTLPNPGFGVAYVPGCWAVDTPFWFWLILTGVLPLRSFAQLVIRRWRRRNGRCENCGYDVRVTPERCPECGKDFASAQLAGEGRGRSFPLVKSDSHG